MILWILVNFLGYSLGATLAGAVCATLELELRLQLDITSGTAEGRELRLHKEKRNNYYPQILIYDYDLVVFYVNRLYILTLSVVGHWDSCLHVYPMLDIMTLRCYSQDLPVWTSNRQNPPQTSTIKQKYALKRRLRVRVKSTFLTLQSILKFLKTGHCYSD